MKEIKFEYKDAYTNGKWSTQVCYVDSLTECLEIYGLRNSDVEYRILEVHEVD